jgi:predicted nucleic acid-binding protein
VTDAAAEEAELLVCDSSFVGAIAQRRVQPERVAHWDAKVLDRIDRARNAISIVTLAESRAGYLIADWGPRRVEQDERRLRAWGLLPLDGQIVDEWARLRAQSAAIGLKIGDNDLWIAATASSYDAPLVTCDLDQRRIEKLLPEVIYLPRHPPAHSSPRAHA